MHKPIKRHPGLQPLSRDHHQGLLLSWKIREGLRRKLEPERIKKYVDWFWQQHLVPHFAKEEQRVFPLLPANEKNIKKALTDHQHLKTLFEQNTATTERLNELAIALENHIRFEERILFNQIQEVMPEADLEALNLTETQDTVCELWEDEFWV